MVLISMRDDTGLETLAKRQKPHSMLARLSPTRHVELGQDIRSMLRVDE